MLQTITPHILHSEIRDTLSIVSLLDGRFHVSRNGSDSVLITGVDFILVRQPLRDIFERLLGEQILIRPAEVLNINTGQLFPGYFELIVYSIDHHDVPQLERGKTVTLWYRSLVVSDDVKNEIEKAGIKNLSFSNDFCLLAAAT